MEITELVGKTLVKIDVTDDTIVFEADSGRKFLMYHEQDCCEYVTIEDICGSWDDLIGSPILTAEERSNEDPNTDESGTWTFYELATIKGSVTIRWYGSSNGYYSEQVDFEEIFLEHKGELN